MYKVPSTELAHSGCSGDTSFFLPHPDSAVDLLYGLEQFHSGGLTSPVKDERIVLSAPRSWELRLLESVMS